MLSPSPLTFSSTPTSPPSPTHIALTQALERAERACGESNRPSAALSTSAAALDELKSTLDSLVAHEVEALREKVERQVKEQSMQHVNEKVRKAVATLTQQQAATERSFAEKLKKNEEKFNRRLAELEDESSDKLRAKLARIQASYDVLVVQASKSYGRIAEKQRQTDLNNVHKENDELRRTK